ncbi:MAG: AI-2E family transporter [Thermoleophilia bacterium]|nr:AI-2E family transporter [Thermoleophilia bacterium]MDH4339361.1 AI-2E family transporter [Thermoleophilia bacterium]MDH5280276.1 AI-2E family transporter [Thermoleophilia bacterium]
MKMPLFDRFSRKHERASDPLPAAAGPAVVQIDATALSRVFSAPMWLRDLGLLAWFLVGVGLVLVGFVWLLGLTSTIVEPVVVGAILATVAGPLVTKMQRHGFPRAAGAAVVLLGLLAIGVVIALLVFGGLYEQSSEIRAAASEGADKVQSWLDDVGIQNTDNATEDAKSGTSGTGATLLKGVVDGIQGLTSLVFFVTFAVFSTFFLLKDGPSVRNFINRNLGVPAAVANTVTGNVILSLRRYFLGVTIVAAFNAVVVGIGAYLLDVPLWGTIAVVTFVTAYVPFIGAFVSGAFAVILTLSAQGSSAALIMLVIVLLANGLLQNIVQPIAFGATLDLNPLAVLIVTIGFGCLFGMIGLVLGAPLTSAALHISRELAAAKAQEAATEGERAPPNAEPNPLGAF